MKNAVFALACAFVFAAAGSAQKPVEGSADPDTYQLGNRTVKIPPPEGFSDIFAGRVAERFRSIEDPANEVLAVHAPDSIAAGLRTAPDSDLELYGKVSVFRRLEAVDITPEMFAQLAGAVEKSMDAYLDPNGATVKRVRENSEKGLSEYLGNKTKVDLTSPKNLGFFDKQSYAFSALVLMTVNVGGTKYPVLFTVSYLNVNSRLIYVYLYKVLNAIDDDEMLRAMTTKWIARIIAANK
jgi:hypothetical protein